jgi:hypothetical protein
MKKCSYYTYKNFHLYRYVPDSRRGLSCRGVNLTYYPFCVFCTYPYKEKKQSRHFLKKEKGISKECIRRLIIQAPYVSSGFTPILMVVAAHFDFNIVRSFINIYC